MDEADQKHRRGLRILAGFWIFAGVMHFVIPKTYEATIPESFRDPALLVSASGVAEIAGGVGVLMEPTRRTAGWGLIALLLAVFPANVNMALNPEEFGVPPALLWARLPLQALFIRWVWRRTLSRS